MLKPVRRGGAGAATAGGITGGGAAGGTGGGAASFSCLSVSGVVGGGLQRSCLGGCLDMLSA